jgi:hypothetical protein
MNVLNLDHRTTGPVYLICPTTGKQPKWAWTDFGRPGSMNACEFCSGDQRTLGQRLHELNKQRSQANGTKRTKRTKRSRKPKRTKKHA